MQKGKLFLILNYWLLLLFFLPSLSAQESHQMVLSIDKMFRLASENSKQLKRSSLVIKTAETTTETIRNALLPTINASVSASLLGDGLITDRNFSHAEDAPMPRFGNNFVFEASQVVYAGGTVSNGIAISRLEEQIAQLDFDKEQMNIRILLTRYYLDLYKLINQKEVYLKNREQTNLLISQVKARQHEGMALGNDVTRYELMLQNIELALIEIGNNCRILNSRLATILGLPGETLIVPDTAILNSEFTPAAASDDLIQVAKQNLPELKSADIRIKVAEKNTLTAKAGYIPTLTLAAADYLNGPVTIEIPPINKNYNYWYAGIGIRYSLSSLYKARRDVNLAKARNDEAIADKNVLEEKASLAVQEACIKYHESFNRLRTFEKSYTLAKQNYEVINYRYINDMVLITEMLDASNAKLEAELQVVNAKISIIFNYYQIKYFSGTI